MDDADAYVQHMQANPSGKLLINAPMALGITDLSHAPDYLATHPHISKVEHLKNLNCFVYSYFRAGNHWLLNEGTSVGGHPQGEQHAVYAPAH